MPARLMRQLQKAFKQGPLPVQGHGASASVSGGNEAGYAAILAAMDRLSCNVQDKVTLVATNAETLQMQVLHCYEQQSAMQSKLDALTAQMQALQSITRKAQCMDHDGNDDAVGAAGRHEN